ncbi:MAG: hypothetical protein MJY84_06995 [Bacteroidales bacterium]|nr:hypothetical protein [Bacteroidales bacterium]
MVSDGTLSLGGVLETSDYLPLGKRWELTGGQASQTVTDPTNRWLAPDPLAEKYYGHSQFAYCLNNSLLFWDDIGKEPVKLFSGTAIGFVTELKTTGTKSGQKQGLAAANSMLL